MTAHDSTPIASADALACLESHDCRDILMNAPIGIFISTPAGRYLAANTAQARMLGYASAQELMSAVNNIAQQVYVHPQDRTEFRHRMEQDGHVVGWECQLRRRDGTLIWISEHATVVRDAQGEVTCYSGFAIDITERRQTEDALRESEVRSRLLADLTMEGIVLHRQGVALDVNASMTAMLGYAREELLDHDFVAFIHPDDVALVQQKMQQAEVAPYSVRMLHRSGEYFCAEVESRNFMQGGELWRVSAIRDVTERVRAREAVAESEARFRGMFEHMKSGVAIYEIRADEQDFVFKDFNPRAEEMTRVRRVDVLGRGLLELFPNHLMLFATLLRVWRTGEPEHMSPFYYQDDVRQGWRENRIFRLPSGEVVAIFEDVTERMESQKALITAKEQADAANQAKSAFLANMSHELRTPLNGVMGMLQLLECGPLEPEQQEYVRMALRASERLTRLLSDILDISRIEAGHISVRNEAFSVQELQSAVQDLFYQSAREKGVVLECCFDPLLPPVLMGDEARVRQILLNLVGNALKFTSQGSVRVEASLVGAACEGRCRVLFSVRDTGIGIADGKVTELFQPFVQVETSYTRKYQGAGLGLAIVRRLVQVLGGHIALESALGEGTAVHVVLPFPAPVAEAGADAETYGERV